MRLSRLVKICLMLLVAVTLGAGSALWATWRGLEGGVVSVGPWRTDPATGATNADPYTRASVALTGLLALNASETVYYTAATDSDGKALTVDCTYRLTGHDLPARWWSITAYGADNYLIPNPQERYSVARSSVIRDADGGFTVSIGPDVASGNWIPTGVPAGKTQFTLTIRLYNPAPEVVKKPALSVLPRIVQESCS